MKLHKQVKHVYVFGHIDDAIAECERLGMRQVDERPVWRADDTTAVVEAVRLPGPAMLICLGDDQRRKDWRNLRPHDDRLAEVHLTYGLYSGDPKSPETLDDPGPVVAAFPVPGCYLLDRLGDDALTLIGPADLEDHIDALVWPTAIGPVPPIPRYLWEAARLERELDSFNAQRVRVQQRQAGLVTQVAHLLDEQPITMVAAREAELRELQWQASLVAADEARLRVQAGTVDAIVANMSVAADWPLAIEFAAARWLTAEIALEADRSHHAVALAEPMARAAEAANAVQLRRLSEHTGHLMTVQTSVIAAVLLVLAVMQSISYTWPAAYFLKLPFIVTLGLAALIVPIWAGHRPTAEEPERHPPRWLAAPIVALGATLGWLVASSVSEATTGDPASIFASTGAAAVAILITAVYALSVRRRRKRRTESIP